MISRIFNFLFIFLILKKVYLGKNINCRRDYSSPCAEGWFKINSEECISNISYEGPCSRLLHLQHDTKKKKLLEKQCNINWPCLIECEKDYSSQCPQNWFPENEKICKPLSTYKGSCLYSYDFSNMNNKQKEIWSNKCETNWPCKEKCKKDYSKFCPKNWIRDNNGLCKAAKNYNGPCLSKASLFTLDKSMKIAFEKLCKIDYPCMRTCKLDVTKSCPKKWLLQSDSFGNKKSCIPPNNYKGNCNQSTNFFNLSLEEIEEISNICDIEWPCTEETYDMINYDEICPEEWTQYENYCIAPQNYEGACMKKKEFTSFSKNVKKEYSEECNIQWPLLKNKKNINKISVLRKGRNNYGAVEPTTGEIVSLV